MEANSNSAQTGYLLRPTAKANANQLATGIYERGCYWQNQNYFSLSKKRQAGKCMALYP